MRRVLAALLLSVLPQFAAAEELRILSWNVESGGADEDVISEQLADFEGYDIVGLCEVRANDAQQYADAVGTGESGDFTYVLGDTGNSDRLVIAFNSTRFELVEWDELDHLRMENGRSPLFAKLRLQSTGQELIFMVNHLYRGDAHKRLLQSQGLNAWAATQNVPVVAVGDYNHDYDVPNGPGNDGFQAMIANGVFTWVKPATLLKTQDSSYNSVLDFVFVNDDALAWQAVSTILVRPNDFPNDESTSDHRPVEAVFETSPVEPFSPVRPFDFAERAALPTDAARAAATDELLRALIEEIRQLRTEIQSLREVIEDR
jgi:endonuclease/exonuclease/phosphatase family metal-dependent hydrolase